MYDVSRRLDNVTPADLTPGETLVYDVLDGRLATYVGRVGSLVELSREGKVLPDLRHAVQVYVA